MNLDESRKYIDGLVEKKGEGLPDTDLEFFDLMMTTKASLEQAQQTFTQGQQQLETIADNIKFTRGQVEAYANLLVAAKKRRLGIDDGKTPVGTKQKPPENKVVDMSKSKAASKKPPKPNSRIAHKKKAPKGGKQK